MFDESKIFSSFSVDDLEAALNFYGEVLNLDIRKIDMGLLEIKLEAVTRVIIYPKADHTPATFTVLNLPVKNIDKVVDHLTEKGVSFEQYPDPITTDEKGISRGTKGPAIAWFKDPAGNIISVLETSEA